MRVLLVETQPGMSTATRHALEHAGHEVVSCATIEPNAPCKGLGTLDECPLDREPTDVAIAVHSGDDVTMNERGALCAARRRVPVVVVGERGRGVNFGPGTFYAGEDLVASCTAAAASGTAHAAAIRRALLADQVLTRDDVMGERPPVVVQVARQTDRLRLAVEVPEGDARAGNIRKAAVAALRHYDPDVSVIDVLDEGRAKGGSGSSATGAA